MEYFHCNIELNSNKKDNYYLNDIEYSKLLEEIIEPYAKKENFLFDGYIINPENIKRIKVVKTLYRAQVYKDEHRAKMRSAGIADFGTNMNALALDKGEDITLEIVKNVKVDLNHIPNNNIEEKQEVKYIKNDVPKVFLVHGQDEGTLRRVKEFIKDDMEMEPIVLMDEENRGRSIPEKFEQYANECDYAIILMTPDDELKYIKDDKEIYRARQNVILELGYFWAKFNRSNFCVLKKGNIETPSDIQGIVYLPFNNSVEEILYKLTKEIKSSLNM